MGGTKAVDFLKIPSSSESNEVSCFSAFLAFPACSDPVEELPGGAPKLNKTDISEIAQEGGRRQEKGQRERKRTKNHVDLFFTTTQTKSSSLIPRIGLRGKCGVRMEGEKGVGRGGWGGVMRGTGAA